MTDKTDLFKISTEFGAIRANYIEECLSEASLVMPIKSYTVIDERSYTEMLDRMLLLSNDNNFKPYGPGLILRLTNKDELLSETYVMVLVEHNENLH